MASLRSLPSTVPTFLILIFLVNVSALTFKDALGKFIFHCSFYFRVEVAEIRV